MSKKLFMVIAIFTLVLGISACKKKAAEVPAPKPAPTNQAAPAAPNIPPTVVAEGKSVEDHLKEYFDAYKEQRLDDAFKLQPAENQAKQPLEQFKQLRQSMPIDSYQMSETKNEGNQAMIDVEYNIGQYGTWISSWVFEKQGDKWVALRYIASQKPQ